VPYVLIGDEAFFGADATSSRLEQFPIIPAQARIRSSFFLALGPPFRGEERVKADLVQPEML
jgi:hypothetical protein